LHGKIWTTLAPNKPLIGSLSCNKKEVVLILGDRGSKATEDGA